MLLIHRSLFLCILPLMLLSGCGSSSYNSTRGTTNGSNNSTSSTSTAPNGNPAPTGGSGISGSEDTVVSTPSAASTVSVLPGANQTVSITFNSSDGLAISGFGMSGNLGMLPPGWSGPGSFSCALVSTGNGCVLNLTYAPTSAGSGMLALDCVFVDDATMPRTPGPCLTLAYAATAQNNVIATASQTGQITAVGGMGPQSVIVNFTTDDGTAATALALTTDLTSLPSGWSSSATSLPCALVSTGSGCQLALTFAPTAPSRGTLTLSYAYNDASGAAKTGALNIPYASASQGAVVATASPSGQVTAVEKSGGQAVAVTFTTDDGKLARNLAITSDLAKLPPGWRAASNSFSCSSASSGNGCQLSFTYAPTALASGTLSLDYAYTNSAGAPASGLLNLLYAATTDDNVVGTASPSGQINAVVGLGGQAVSVAFTTDDGRTATGLQLTSSLSALPPGWSSSDASFTCGSLSAGGGCQLPLRYSPSAADGGMLILSYLYKNNAGAAKTGTLNIAYRATTDDNVVGTPSQSSLVVASGSSVPVDIVFTTDDGNPANALLVTSGLGALPTGWSSASTSFSCSSVSIGSGCQLALRYSPTVADVGALAIGFSYINDSGIAKTATATISYTATP